MIVVLSIVALEILWMIQAMCAMDCVDQMKKGAKKERLTAAILVVYGCGALMMTLLAW
jgi:hypothetical protein